MSLLLEALKKAELAKQSSLGTAPPAEDAEEGGLRFEEPAEPTIGEPAFAEPTIAEPTMQRDPIAEFAAPAPGRAAAPALALSPEPQPLSPAPRPPRAAPPSQPDEASAPIPDPQRAAARQLFDVKEVDYNPKRPFYITLGVLGLAAVGYGGYLWWQLQPRATVNTAAIQNAPKSAPIARVAPPPPPTEPGAAPGTQASPTPPAATAETAPAPVAAQAAGTPASKPAAAAPAKPEAAAAAGSPASVPTPATFLRQGQAAAKAAAPPPAATPATAPGTAARPRAAAPRTARLPIKVTPPAFQANQVLESAYAAFQRGEYDRAKTEYQQVLSREATSRDALLGLAAIDVRAREYATAELRYLKLLELDPRDAHAHAALIALQGNVDPVQTESRIKNLIAGQPDATHLYFTLGNQYAAQARWADAQNAYFKAFSAEPDNADFAFNLAVSLDHLRQSKLAGEYYRKAIALAGNRPAGFDRKQAESRAQELQR
ncbi:MAG: hypothetical protein A3H35_17780 [Betaproteobacteria bacterium RIFCSPLOWO2_02_FULL_62_17]|nr:MAG: hypothetical protein A3H35_17780 [Betaproteobacteria bacterium RIFCSPLOWO2_02_FULL_62_17]